MTDKNVTRLGVLTGLLMMGTSPAALAQQEPTVEDVGDTGGIERMTVTAQKQEEDLLDVPIAITAFDAEALTARQIDNFSDLQFNTPNVSFSKTSFTGSNFQIRGIGNQLVAASADSGVAVHVNDYYINAPRLFETEYFDVERVEVLRGPQGTLYGRNATGGAINMITAKPRLDEYSAYAELEVGNLGNFRANGHANIPIVKDKLAIRLAGLFLERDGFTETVDPDADFDDLDSRNQFSIRGSLRWEVSEDTLVDIVASYYREDDSRQRATKTLVL